MAEYEQSYWWHLGRLRIIQTYLQLINRGRKNLKILNVGSGTGGTVNMLETFGHTDNVDTSEEAIRYMRRQGHKNVTKVEGVALPFKNKTYDVVGAFDVLEHIPEEIAALKEWKRVLKDDGAILITVPAYQWLWSSHDISLHHQRRYTIGRLQAAAKKAGLRLEKRSYAIFFSLALIVGFRMISKIQRRPSTPETSYVVLPVWVNTVFTKLLYGEALLHRKLSLPAGSTVIAILRKTEEK